MAFDINVLIRLKQIDSYSITGLNELDKRSFIKQRDIQHYIPKDQAYNILNKVIMEISQKLWRGGQSKVLFYTEMLLFTIADREIYNDNH